MRRRPLLTDCPANIELSSGMPIGRNVGPMHRKFWSIRVHARWRRSRVASRLCLCRLTAFGLRCGTAPWFVTVESCPGFASRFGRTETGSEGPAGGDVDHLQTPSGCMPDFANRSTTTSERQLTEGSLPLLLAAGDDDHRDDQQTRENQADARRRAQRVEHGDQQIHEEGRTPDARHIGTAAGH
jgi:hypothetical protein